MPMATKTVPITEARANLPKIVKDADERLDRTVITSNGRPAAVIMSYDEYESWEETLEILSDPETVQALRQADKELANGKIFSFEDVFGHPQPKIKKTRRPRK
jgi:antitoxin YefM